MTTEETTLSFKETLNHLIDMGQTLINISNDLIILNKRELNHLEEDLKPHALLIYEVATSLEQLIKKLIEGQEENPTFDDETTNKIKDLITKIQEE